MPFMMRNESVQMGPAKVAKLGMAVLLGMSACAADPAEEGAVAVAASQSEMQKVMALAKQGEATAIAAFNQAYPEGLRTESGELLTAETLRQTVEREAAQASRGEPARRVSSHTVALTTNTLLPPRMITLESRAECESQSNCAPRVEVVDLGFNLHYGYHCGAGWGSGTTKVYDDVDACCYFHDNGCWSISNGLDLGNQGCSQTVNLIACVEAVQPQSPETAEAKSFILNSFLGFGANVCELRPAGATWPPRGWIYPLQSPALGVADRCRLVDPSPQFWP